MHVAVALTCIFLLFELVTQAGLHRRPGDTITADVVWLLFVQEEKLNPCLCIQAELFGDGDVGANATKR